MKTQLPFKAPKGWCLLKKGMAIHSRDRVFWGTLKLSIEMGDMCGMKVNKPKSKRGFPEGYYIRRIAKKK